MKKLLASILAFLMLALPLSASAAITFLEPGGDADFTSPTTGINSFWFNSLSNSNGTLATDFVHGMHKKSIKFAPSGTNANYTPSGVLSDSGSRISFYVYINALPSATASLFQGASSVLGNLTWNLRLTSGGVLQLWNSTTAQVGSNGATLSTGTWYRISLAYTMTSGTVNRFEIFSNGASTISVTNGTFTNTLTKSMRIGNISANSTLDIRISDIYIDNSSSLTDTGDIWVTAKRPVANGTTNGFTTQIGAGGSGYPASGGGHSPQVNERPLDTTNGWSMVGAGSAITEEYNIENAATGDINLSNATIVGYEGWVSASSLASESLNMILNGTNFSSTTNSVAKMFLATTTSATYPAGTGTDIGIITTTDLTTVSLYEAGIVVAYIPGGAEPTYNGFFNWIEQWWWHI